MTGRPYRLFEQPWPGHRCDLRLLHRNRRGGARLRHATGSRLSDMCSLGYHRGVFVEPFDGQSILDDFEIMGLLSGLAVQRLAERQDTDAISTLRTLLDQLRATRPANRDQVYKLVSDFRDAGRSVARELRRRGVIDK